MKAAREMNKRLRGNVLSAGQLLQLTFISLEFQNITCPDMIQMF